MARKYSVLKKVSAMIGRLRVQRVRIVDYQQVRPVVPPIAFGLNRGPAAPPEETRNAASPIASCATISSPSPTRCRTRAPNAAS